MPMHMASYQPAPTCGGLKSNVSPGLLRSGAGRCACAHCGRRRGHLGLEGQPKNAGELAVVLLRNAQGSVDLLLQPCSIKWSSTPQLGARYSRHSPERQVHYEKSRDRVWMHIREYHSRCSGTNPMLAERAHVIQQGCKHPVRVEGCSRCFARAMLTLTWVGGGWRGR